MIFNMIDYYKMIRERNLSIIYSGPVWADGIEGFAEMIKKRLEFDDVPLSAAQSVFSVFVEQINNISMYSAEKTQLETVGNESVDVSQGVFILGVRDKEYFLQCGNMIKNESVEFIKGRIDYLNTLDRPGLRKFYMEKIKTGDDNPESHGAGLGLIEIARRASSKIEYSFTPLENGLTFYAMYVRIGEGRV